jgi:hypothetical protein
VLPHNSCECVSLPVETALPGSHVLARRVASFVLLASCCSTGVFELYCPMLCPAQAGPGL